LVRFLLITIGTISLGIGFVGVVLPVLPTTPFLLFSSFCFLKSSKRLDNWFKKTNLYNKFVQPIKDGKGMSFKTKISILLFVYTSLGLAFVLTRSLHLRVVIILLLVIKTLAFIKIKTSKE
jgi:uncharacterized protein